MRDDDTISRPAAAPERESLSERLESLRRNFDEGFSRPLTPPEERCGVLSIRVSGERFALQVEHLSALMRAPKVVPVPADVPSLVGIAGIRGRAVPVLGLASLLGLPVSADSSRWIAVTCGDAPVGFAFDALEEQRWIARSNLEEVRGSGMRHVRQIAHLEDGRVPVLSLEDLIGNVRGGSNTGKES